MRTTDAIPVSYIQELIEQDKRLIEEYVGIQDFEVIVDGLIERSIDAEPVRHGKWIEYPIADGMNQCSVCGVLRFGESNYCPNCGARMDEE